MSYCVNCGVKLAESEKVCPLCDTEVINPNNKEKQDEYVPYPHRMEKYKDAVNKRFLGVIGAFILMIPAAVALIFHILGGFRDLWEIYVYGSMVLIFFCCIFPLFFKRPNVYVCIALDGVVTALFVALIAWISGGMLGWYLPFGLPITALFATLVDLSVLASRLKRPPYLIKCAIIMFLIAVSSIIFEVVLGLTFYSSFGLYWCWVVFAVFVIMGGMLIMLNSRTGWQDILRRRLFR